MLGFQDAGDRLTFANGDGAWTLWKRPVRDGGRFVGPGYIGRFVARDSGVAVIDDLREPVRDGAGVPDVGSPNNPNYGGGGAFAAHYFPTRDEPYEVSVRRHRDLWPHVGAVPIGAPEIREVHDAILAAFSVDAGPVQVDYHYAFRAECVQQWVKVTQREDGWIKEPKVVVAVNPPGGSRYTKATVYSRQQVLRHVDMTRLRDPHRATRQLDERHRARVGFHGDDRLPELNVVAMAADNQRTKTAQWWGSRHGFDAWAMVAMRRPALAPGDATCKRRWEMTGWGDRPSPPPSYAWGDPGAKNLQLDAWQGGTGLGDARQCARRMKLGEAWTAYLCYSLGKGFRY